MVKVFRQKGSVSSLLSFSLLFFLFLILVLVLPADCCRKVVQSVGVGTATQKRPVLLSSNNQP